MDARKSGKNYLLDNLRRTGLLARNAKASDQPEKIGIASWKVTKNVSKNFPL